MKPDFDKLSWSEVLLLWTSLVTLALSLAYLLLSF